MKVVFDELLRRLRSPKPDLLLFIYGAAGSGKSRFSWEFVKEIVKLHWETLLRDLAMIPIVHIELEAESERMSWGHAYRDLLCALRDILIENKIKVPLRDIEPKLEIPPGDKASTEKYLHACIAGIVQRKLKAVLWDNANLFAMNPTRRKEWILNPLLGLCKYTPQVLLGTKEILTLRNLNGQAARRGNILHLRRYFLNEEDQEHFDDALATFAIRLPIDKPPDLVKMSGFLYDGCVGCIGVLSDWLAEALQLALDEGCGTITKEHLEATRLPESNLQRLETEAAEGESLMASAGNGRMESRQALRQAEATLIKKSRTGAAAKGKEVKPRKKGRSRRHPGTPKPKRNPIGIEAFPQDIRDELKA